MPRFKALAQGQAGPGPKAMAPACCYAKPLHSGVWLESCAFGMVVYIGYNLRIVVVAAGAHRGFQKKLSPVKIPLEHGCASFVMATIVARQPPINANLLIFSQGQQVWAMQCRGTCNFFVSRLTTRKLQVT